MRQQARRALGEIGAVLDRIDDADTALLVERLAAARRIVLHGLGREGLMMRAFAMRLFHLGLDAHVLGDVTMPPVGPGDLLVASCGPGHLASVETFLRIAREAGCETLCVTAQPEGRTVRAADHRVVIPAQTMADDRPADGHAPASLLPMGSLFEAAQLVFFELVVLRLRDRIDVTPEAMRARHTNLE